MPLYRDECVVLRTHKLGEADRIVTMLSRQHGKIRAVAKGVRRTASKFGSRLEPFVVVDAQFYEGRSLDIVTQAESLGSYGAQIAADYGAYTAASAMVETADRLSDADVGIQQYLLLVGALRSLSRREHPSSSTLDSYLLRAMSIAGWAPSFRDCAVTGAPGPHSAFVVQLGGVVADSAAPPGSPRLDVTTLDLLGALLAGEWGTVDASDERTRSRASGVVAAYAQWHLERSLRSLPHVDRTESPAPVATPVVAPTVAQTVAPVVAPTDAQSVAPTVAPTVIPAGRPGAGPPDQVASAVPVSPEGTPPA